MPRAPPRERPPLETPPISRWARWRRGFGVRWWPFLLVAVCLAIAHAPIFAGRIVLYRDPAHWNTPARWFVRHAILTGDSPFWNPLEGLGFPTLADPLYGIFYPLNWLFLLTPAGLVAAMATWQSFAHLIAGAFGIMVIARRMRVGSVGVAVAGLAWGLSGTVTTSWSAGLLLLAFGLVPWAAVGFIALAGDADGPDGVWLRGVWKAATPVALALLMGEVFVAIMGVAFGLATMLAIRHGDGLLAPKVPRWRLPVSVGLALALAAGIGAVVVLPARMIGAETDRAAAIPRALAEVGSFHPIRLLETVFPGALGYPYESFPGARWIGEATLNDVPLLFGVYAGAAVVVLALGAISRRRLPLILAALWMAALVISFGRHAPVHATVRRLIPPLSYMRYPEKYQILCTSWLALLAGMGADRFMSGRSVPWRRILAALVVFIVVAAAGHLMVPVELAGGVEKGALHATLVVGILLSALGFRHVHRHAVSALLVLVVALDLIVAAAPYGVFSPRDAARVVPPAAKAIHHRAADAVGRSPPPRIYRDPAVDHAMDQLAVPRSVVEGEALGAATLVANEVTTFGLATASGYEAAIPTRLIGLWGKGTTADTLRLFGIDHAVLAVTAPSAPDHRLGLSPILDPVPGARLYAVDNPLPRVFLAARAEIADDDQAIARARDPAVVGGDIALLAPETVATKVDSALTRAAPGRAGDCQFVGFSNDHLSVRCRANQGALAVFVEQHAPGWHARVDGGAVPLLRANVVMRAVPIGPGEHRIDLDYAPPGLTVAVAICLTALFALLTTAFWARREEVCGETSPARRR